MNFSYIVLIFYLLTNLSIMNENNKSISSQMHLHEVAEITNLNNFH